MNTVQLAEKRNEQHMGLTPQQIEAKRAFHAKHHAKKLRKQRHARRKAARSYATNACGASAAVLAVVALAYWMQ